MLDISELIEAIESVFEGDSPITQEEPVLYCPGDSMIVSKRFLYHKNYLEQRRKFFKEYNNLISGVYWLGEVSETLPVDSCLICPAKDITHKVMFGNISKPILNEKGKYTKEGLDYFEVIEEWENDQYEPWADEEEPYEFLFVSSDYWIKDEADETIPDFRPDFYTRTHMWYSGALKNEEPTHLFFYADILQQSLKNSGKRSLRDERGRYAVLTGSSFNSGKRITIGHRLKEPEIKLQAGDILISNSRKELRAFLCKEGDDGLRILSPDILEKKYFYDIYERVYVSRDYIVIRPRDDISDYLYLYFNSEFGRELFRSEVSKDEDIPVFNIIQTMLIVPPAREREEYYHKQIDNFLNENFYASLAKAPDIRRPGYGTIEWSGTLDKASDVIFSMGLDFQKLFRKYRIEDFMQREMAEVRKCERSGAYKAAVIMLGSVLEAFMILCISELEDKDFFENDRTIYLRAGDKLSDLKSYIEYVRNMKTPNWNKEADIADKIRYARNYVHPRKSKDIIVDKGMFEEMKHYLEIIEKSIAEDGNL